MSANMIGVDWMTLTSVAASLKGRGPDRLVLTFQGAWHTSRAALASILPPDLAERLDTGRPHEFGVSMVQFTAVLCLRRWCRVRVTVVPGARVTIRVETDATRPRDPNEEAGIVRPRFATEKAPDLLALTPEEWAVCGLAAGTCGRLMLLREEREPALDLVGEEPTEGGE